MPIGTGEMHRWPGDGLNVAAQTEVAAAEAKKSPVSSHLALCKINFNSETN
jgi:hypothetical protein